MNTLSINNGFDHMSDPNLQTRSYQIVTGMTDNPHFATPTPTVEEMNANMEEFFNALNDCKDGDRLKIAIKNQKREVVINSLHLWSAYVLSQSAGDVAIAMTSNFTIRKTTTRKPPIGKPENFSVVAGANPLDLQCRVNKVDGAHSYNFMYATEEMMASNNWQIVSSTQIKCIIPGLVSGTIYNCRVAAIGPRNQIMYSDIIRCRVA